MTRKLIQKQDLKKFVQSLRRDQVAFYAPLQVENKVDFAEIGPGVVESRSGASSAINFDYRNTDLPPKRFFRPACQETGVIEKDEIKEVPAAFSNAILFGVRPCDALSFAQLDKVFLEGDYIDEFYQARREATTVVALACAAVADTCFCRALGSGPTSSAGADVLAFDLGQALLCEACTEKGETLLTGYASCFADVGKNDLAQKEKRYASVRGGAAEPAALPGKEKLLASFHSPSWERVSETCLGCNVCAYFCPTCHCFVLADEKRRERGKRVRVEDSCLNRNFTAEASGHDPRPTARERMRQRIMHKFAYGPDLYGERLCVGCGRCIANCPVNIDVRETLARVCE